ncbi:MAG: CPBP family intramembrane metalloprotease [Acidobacteriaceae bacterium]|nr:CPBP family intramembrane metalloprotease [Acidobacteriaceae bacterium]
MEELRDPEQLTPQEPPVAAFTKPEEPNSVFFGRFGMRAGWGFAIYVVLSIVIMSISGVFAVGLSGQFKAIQQAHAYAAAHPGQVVPPVHRDLMPIFPIANDGIEFLGLLGICWFFAKGERRPMRAYGLGRNRVWDILPGALWGLAMMTALIGVLHAGGWLIFDGLNVHGATALAFGIKWLIGFICVGFAEEYMFRGYLQFTLMRGVWGLGEKLSPQSPFSASFWLAATLMSVLFAAVHIANGGETAFGILQVFVAGMVFSYALWRTGSLWWGVGFHATWDWAQSFLFGVPDSGGLSFGRLFNTHVAGPKLLSGGTTGPEGSVFGTVALLLTLVAIALVKRGPQPSPEPEPKPASEGFHNSAA